MSTPTIPAPRIAADTAPVLSTRRVRVTGDLFHGRVPAGAVYVGRQAPGLSRSRFANRHKVGDCPVCRIEHDRAEAITAYATDLDQTPKLLRAARSELAGRELACWCPLDVACHADVLVAVVTRPRVWLAGAQRGRLAPADRPVVRDDLMRHWHPASGGYRTADGRHHATWAELHARFDLVEVA